jgi:hypothetical protein
MSRRGRLILWVACGWLLGPIGFSPVQGQTDRLLPVATLAQRPVPQRLRNDFWMVEGEGLVLAPRKSAPFPTCSTSSADLLDDPTACDLGGPAVPRQSFDLNVQADDRLWGGPLHWGQPLAEPLLWGDCYHWQFLPDGLIYKSYLAGGKEPRFGSQWVYARDHGWLWDATLGGRVGLLRYGTSDDIYPEGWQVDLEGAAFPRMDLGVNHDRELVSADFRAGIPWTVRQGPWEGKFGYYHLSSHLGDEFLEVHPGTTRINYVRDCLVLGIALRPCPDLRLYTEAGWAFNVEGGAEPWEFQFGIDYSPLGPSGILGAPFFAINGHLREEVDFGGGLTVETGWQWAGRTGHLLRAGMHYFNGMSDQRQFFADHEELIGLGLWYDY